MTTPKNTPPSGRKLGSFKKPPAPPPPAVAPALTPQQQTQATVEALGGLAGIPLKKAPAKMPDFLPAGTVLTDFEKEGLKTLNIDPANPIPSDLAAKIAAAQNSLKGPAPLPVPADTPPLKMPAVVDVRDLPAEKQAEIAEAARQFVAVKQAERAAAQATPTVNTRTGGVELINDLIPEALRGQPMAPPPPVDPSALGAQGPSGPGPGLQGEATAGGELGGCPPNCPHCGFDLKLQDNTPVTDDDKMNFVQSILGGLRFKKQYELLGGRLRVVFRSLLAAESDMAFRQVAVDAQTDLKNRVMNDTQFYWRNMVSYRMVMALESTESDLAGKIEVPPIGDIEVDDDAYAFPDTKLVAVHDRIVGDVLPGEQLRAMVGHAYNEFQALCDKLQVMAERPDFWTAIG